MINLKKDLYKITAYHCPACGGITKPNKRFCEYCGRDLGIRQNNKKGFRARFLIDCGNYIYFDNLHHFTIEESLQDVDCVRDVSGYLHRVYLPPQRKFELEFQLTERTREFLDKCQEGIHDTRIEVIDSKYELAFESKSYVCSLLTEFQAAGEIVMQKIQLVEYAGYTRYDTAIPDKIVAEMRCPNCGAPIKSRYGACDYCSGWTAVEW